MLTSQSYTKPLNRQSPRKDPVQKFFSRIHSALTALEKIQQQLPPETWARFVVAYSQHWTFSIESRERPTAPTIYLTEWLEANRLGRIGIDTDTAAIHAARNYGVYESPREKARKTLGFDEMEAV